MAHPSDDFCNLSDRLYDERGERRIRVFTEAPKPFSIPVHTARPPQRYVWRLRCNHNVVTIQGWVKDILFLCTSVGWTRAHTISLSELEPVLIDSRR